VRLLRQTSLTLRMYSFTISDYLGQRYILNKWHGNTSGVYAPNVVEG
jgi:hypothetical protein